MDNVEMAHSPVMPLMDAMDLFVATAIAKFANRVEVLSAFDLLDWSGDDWPQPAPLLTGMAGKRLQWEDLPGPQEAAALLKRMRIRRERENSER